MKRITLFAIAALALLLAGTSLAPATSHAQPNPAQSLVGQSVTACKADVRFRFSVVEADWTGVLVDRTASANALWLGAIADITNLGPRYEYAQGRVKVRDNQGREFSWRLFNGLDQYVETDLAYAYDLTPSWEGIAPGATQRAMLVFEVPADARAFTLLPDDLACSAAGTAPAGTAPAPPPPPPPSMPAPAPSPAPSSAPAMTSAPPAPGAPETLARQTLEACKDDLRFRIVAVRADSRAEIADHPAEPGSVWVVLVADITNLGTRADNAQPLARVRDDRGREYEWTLFNGADLYVETDTAAEYRVTPSWELIPPGRTVQTVLLFHVPADARALTLIPFGIGCGN